MDRLEIRKKLKSLNKEVSKLRSDSEEYRAKQEQILNLKKQYQS